jgi:hypothetical protein
MSSDSSPKAALTKDALATAEWESFCAGGACLEVASVNGVIVLRNSTDPDGDVVALSRPELADFIAAARRGALDHLVA